MTIKPYRTYQDPVFKNPVTKIDTVSDRKKLLTIMQDLYDTHFQDSKKIGVGLAANQIGHPYSVFLSYVSEEAAKRRNCQPLALEFWVNASYQAIDKETNLGPEGCFSVPDLFGRYVKRFNKVSVKAEKVEFSIDSKKQLSITAIKPVALTLEDLHARIFQHEIDHLDLTRPKFYFEYVEGGIDALESIEKYYASLQKNE